MRWLFPWPLLPKSIPERIGGKGYGGSGTQYCLCLIDRSIFDKSEFYHMQLFSQLLSAFIHTAIVCLALRNIQLYVYT